jgi:hypothetical protein
MAKLFKVCDDRNVEEAFERFLEPDVDFLSSTTSSSMREHLTDRMKRVRDLVQRLALRRRNAQIERDWARFSS